MRWRGVLGCAAIAATLGAGTATASAATLEFIGNYVEPVHVTSEPPVHDRLLIVEREGRILREHEGATTLFLDITHLVESGGQEEGLLSVAPAPDYATTKRFYVFYVDKERPGHPTDPEDDLHIDEFTATSHPVDPATRRPVLRIPHPTFHNHNGGQLQFGPGGYLYISTGDGGGTPQQAKNTDSLLGKILRIDPRPTVSGAYGIPPDNPFVGGPGADEIWSYGLRHPFRFSFDRANGALLIGDVGGGSREEVDYASAPDAGRGFHFGWPCREGTIAGPDGTCAGDPGFAAPIHDYDHTGGNCAITGGYVSRDPGIPELAGRYLYADFCVGAIRSLVPTLPLDDRDENLDVVNPSSFGQDTCGRLYVASLAGPVFRIDGAAPTDCPPVGSDDPPPGGEPPPGADPPPDADPPELVVRASERRQRPGSVTAKMVGDESGEGTLRAAILRDSRVLIRLEKKRRELEADVPETVRWALGRSDTRSVRRALDDDQVRVRFRGRATDAAGNVSPVAERLVAMD